MTIMCLSIAMDRPGDVLATGEHAGFPWQVIHNRMGYRCGYIRVPVGHPWHGKDYGEIDPDPEVHGGLTFTEPDQPCAAEGAVDDGWWLGFDLAHSGDAPDPALATEYPMPTFPGDVVRTQEYAEAECRSFCEQALAAAAPA